MRRFSRFLWLDWAKGLHAQYHEDGEYEFWQGEHDGYRRLGVTCRRTIKRCGDVWNVTDDILGDGEHQVRLHWVLPDFPAVVDVEAGSMQLRTSEGIVHIRATCNSREFQSGTCWRKNRW